MDGHDARRIPKDCPYAECAIHMQSDPVGAQVCVETLCWQTQTKGEKTKQTTESIKGWIHEYLHTLHLVRYTLCAS